MAALIKFRSQFVKIVFFIAEFIMKFFFVFYTTISTRNIIILFSHKRSTRAYAQIVTYDSCLGQESSAMYL